MDSYLIDICCYLTAWPRISQPCWVSVFSHRKSRRQTTWFQRCPGAQKFPQWRYKCQKRSLSVVQVHLRPAHCPLAKGQWFPNLDVHSNHLGNVSLQQAYWGTVYMQLRGHNLNCTVRWVLTTLNVHVTTTPIKKQNTALVLENLLPYATISLISIN